MPSWLEADTPRRRLVIAFGIYATTVAVFALIAAERLLAHTPFNHFAHLADAWLHGRQDIIHGGPAYAMGNDFAEYGGKTFISFPPFPAVLMLPFVWLSGGPEGFRDGQFIVWLSGIAPASLFLALEHLRRGQRSERSERDNALLAFLFAFATVYFFTSVQGTVWFAGHVVGAGLLCLFWWVALDARHPVLAGLFLGCAFLTRPTTAPAGLIFVFEAWRRASAEGFDGDNILDLDAARRSLDRKNFARSLLLFSLPVAACIAFASWTNFTRFGTLNPTAFGHEHLTVFWRERIARWGLFGLHYLPKNLGCFLTILPWLPPKGVSVIEGAPFKINEHGLALWFTSPIYFWLFRPKKMTHFAWVCVAAAAIPCLFNLLYQNSGWRQFGYRFSNDYAPSLFILLAVGGRSFGAAFRTCAVWAIGWNAFGAVSFDRAKFDRFYFRDGSQNVVYQPD